MKCMSMKNSNLNTESTYIGLYSNEDLQSRRHDYTFSRHLHRQDTVFLFKLSIMS